MQDLTLVIPAKKEAESLPSVLKEIENLECSKIVVLEENDKETIESIKDFNVTIIFQNGKGYGNALIQGINNVHTNYLCIFNADGSFNPKELQNLLNYCQKFDYVFASRYLKNASSEDDTILTKLGNLIFTFLGNILFSLSLSDILYTFVIGKTNSFKKLNLKSDDFCLCVEIPINAKKMKQSYTDVPSNERRRIAGKKKVNEFSDGMKILKYMLHRLIKK